MNRFVDETIIEISSGCGGDGIVHFRREKYIPKGGPDGGDGGDGGNVVFIVKKNLKTLSGLRARRVYRAENGKSGSGGRKHGKNGRDVIVEVPPGTLVKDHETGDIIRDLTNGEDPWICLEGGSGGKGNWHFRTSTNQTPRYAQKGKHGKYRKLLLELRLIADIGLVGLPNAGKSTLLSVLTEAHPKIGSYPFTTKIPNIGVMPYYDRDIICADIPGIIEGASHGAGLGLRFLKHISRTRVLVFLIDLNDHSSDLSLDILMKEVKSYSVDLINKPRILIGTKMDLQNTQEKLDQLVRDHPGETVVGISAVTMSGIDELKKILGVFAAR